jgi:hypothetical protein
MQVVNEINVASPSLSRTGCFTEGIKLELNSLRSFRVIHVKRKANFVVHVLIKTTVFHVKDSI